MLFFDAKANDRRMLLLEPAVVFLLIMLYIWWLRFTHPTWVLAIFGLVLASLLALVFGRRVGGSIRRVADAARSLQLFGREVMPAFTRQFAGQRV